MSARAIFLDRDGTLIREAEYLSDPAGVELLPGTVAGLKRLAGAGYKLIVVSNQSGVARGFFDEFSVIAVQTRLQDLLAQQGVRLDRSYYCPHHPQGTVEAYQRECECRKPKTGMLQQARQEFDLDLAASWMIGDKTADIECGRAAGCGTVLVLTGYGEQSRRELSSRPPDLIVPDLDAAAQAILAQASA